MKTDLRILATVFLINTLLETLAMSSQPLLMRSILDHLTTGRGVQPLLLWYSAAVIAIIILEYLGQRLQSQYQKIALDKLRLRVVDSVFGTTPLRLSKNEIADGVAAVTNDVPVIVGEYYGAWLMIGMRAVMITVMAVSVFSLGGPYFILIAVSTFLTLMVPKAFKRETSRRRKVALAHAHEMNGVLQDVFSCLPAITATLTRPAWRRRFIEKSDRHTTAERAVGFYSAKVNVVVGLTFFVGQLSLVWLACFLIARGQSSVGAFIAASQFATMLVSPVQSLAAALNKLNSGRTAVAALDAAYPMRSFLPSDQGVILKFESLDIEGVVVKYGDGRRVEIPDLHVLAGEKVLLRGPNGCGKSTLFDVLLGGVVPIAGDVRINGRVYSEIPPAAVLNMFGVAPQETVLGDVSILENVSMLRELSRSALQGALKQVGLSDGFRGTSIDGEQSRGLSGGERQRIGLARVLASIFRGGGSRGWPAGVSPVWLLIVAGGYDKAAA